MHRRLQIDAFRQTLVHLQVAGVRRVYVGGSFVGPKQVPRDIDLLIAPHAQIEGKFVRAAASLAWSRNMHTYGADKPVTNISSLFMTDLVRGKWSREPPTFLEFFQHTRDGTRVGIVGIDLTRYVAQARRN